MSARKNGRRRRRKAERSSLQLLEESFHLLRRADPGHYLALYAGAVPFALGLLYFTADAGRAGRDAAGSGGLALGMAALYLALRASQASFCARLWTMLQPGRPRTPAGAGFRGLAALFLVQSVQIPLLVVAAFFVIPLPWVVAGLQNATALSLAAPGARPGLRDLVGRSLRYSHDQWAQNHGVLLVLAFVALFTWANVLVATILLFGLGKSLLGIESVFTTNFGAVFASPTFHLAVLLATYLLLSPMLKAVYVLRCFYASSRESGADLLARLEQCRQGAEPGPGRTAGAGGSAPSGRARAGALAGGAVLIAVLLLAAPALPAAENAPAPPVPATGTAPGTAAGAPGAGGAGAETDAEALRAEIARVLVQSKYRWKLPREIDEDAASGSGWVTTQLRNAAKRAHESVTEWLAWAWEMLERLFVRRASQPAGGGMDGEVLKALKPALSVALLALVAGLAAWAGWLVYRRHQANRERLADGTFGGAVDLRSESIIASQLPEDEWMRLAREQVEQGDRRLAMRAVFLATLANLGESRLVGVARFKSNRDYRSELERRARRFGGLRGAFDENISLFERSWYGAHPATEEGYARFLANYETIVRESTLASERVRRLPLAG